MIKKYQDTRSYKSSTMIIKLILVAIFIINIKINIAFADFSGRVIRIIDGDTLEILVNKQHIRVRLAQIDAPEKKQAFGARAQQALSYLTFHKDVNVIEAEKPDIYGRTIGTIYIGTMNINKELVRQGMAWAYRRYITNHEIIQIEAKARSAKCGLWVDPSPIPPWKFRSKLKHTPKSTKNHIQEYKTF